MQVNWIKCKSGTWCGFHTVNLEHHHFDNMEGVYIIWQGKGPIIRVGQGFIRDRISDHRIDEEINIYSTLYVTWANVSASERDGVERYLADRLNPEVGSAFPDVYPITVNLPWPGW